MVGSPNVTWTPLTISLAIVAVVALLLFAISMVMRWRRDQTSSPATAGEAGPLVPVLGLVVAVIALGASVYLGVWNHPGTDPQPPDDPPPSTTATETIAPGCPPAVDIVVPPTATASFSGTFVVKCPPAPGFQYWLVTRFQNVGPGKTTNYYPGNPDRGQTVPSAPGTYEIPLNIATSREDRCYAVVSVPSPLTPGAEYVDKLPDGASLASDFACTDVP